MLRGLLNVGGGVPVGTEARAGLSDTADTNTNINPTTSGAILRSSRRRLITPPSERERSTKSTTRKDASRAFVAGVSLTIIAFHEYRPGTRPSSLASTDQTGAHGRASARARARPAVPRRGRLRQWIRGAADVPAAVPHDHHDAPDGGRLVAHVVAVRGVGSALAGLQPRPSGLARDDLRCALDRGGAVGHRGGPRLPLAEPGTWSAWDRLVAMRSRSACGDGVDRVPDTLRARRHVELAHAHGRERVHHRVHHRG